MGVGGGEKIREGEMVREDNTARIKTQEEKSSEQLRPPSKLGPQGAGAVLSGRLVDS